METDDIGGAGMEGGEGESTLPKNNRGEIASERLPKLNYFEGNSWIESSRFRCSGEKKRAKKNKTRMKKKSVKKTEWMGE